MSVVTQEVFEARRRAAKLDWRLLKDCAARIRHCELEHGPACPERMKAKMDPDQQSMYHTIRVLMEAGQL